MFLELRSIVRPKNSTKKDRSFVCACAFFLSDVILPGIVRPYRDSLGLPGVAGQGGKAGPQKNFVFFR